MITRFLASTAVAAGAFVGLQAGVASATPMDRPQPPSLNWTSDITTPCGPALDGAVIFDDGVGYECRNVGPGAYGWVRID